MKPYERSAKIHLIMELEYKISSIRREVGRDQWKFHQKLKDLEEFEKEIDNNKDELFVLLQALRDLEEVVGIKAEDITDEERSGVYIVR